ncbi:MAG: bifunctional diaminohydroxyphosphoribosylaminopyrimidine deaminase / 5-amino-6-(5-phosphoribosylamino)uracil reductase RibD [Phormidesmis priestleyi Ana]|uniref:Riboflavin biosynthesis protein RibD n=1 Tax=Phormidesmis priestleyi Ana TaxID=1666911 RepID=A0A0P8DKN9_9CYAN|nr:MAG: bifunctional diaminohydroxyphosphoribosylaminopyrimidine deaminase / 5-amino-6-(5-phosphoribosylamino)uracil reductase RibD [Phormidesmis priestleyi Ana]
MPQSVSLDAAMMGRCCELALQAAGHTAPNPMVGSVIVQGEEIVGEGFHPKAGEPHAEVFALQAAGDRAQNATLYVNLEPCKHTGRTPPCSEAIIQAGIRRVVIGMADPNPTASGGIQKLQAAGLEVSVGVEGDRCRQINEAFIHRVTHHSPFGIFKYAMTLDGKIATTTGHSAWISGPQSRIQVHRLRGQCDAVIVGGNTVRKDNPHLTNHGQGSHTPLRVVMSRQLNLPLTAHLWNTATAPTLVMTQPNANLEVQQALQVQGVEIISVPNLTPAVVMRQLYERDLMSVLWECGGALAAEAITQGAVQKVWAFIAPKIIGGATAPSPVGELGLTQMSDARSLKNVTITPIDEDFLLQGYL